MLNRPSPQSGSAEEAAIPAKHNMRLLGGPRTTVSVRMHPLKTLASIAANGPMFKRIASEVYRPFLL